MFTIERRRDNRTNRLTSFTAGVLISSIALIRTSFLATSEQKIWIQSVPDDAFYYIMLARNAARNGSWSLDGVEPTSGFHLTYGYLLRLLFEVWPQVDARELFIIVATVASLALGIASALLVATAIRVWGSAAIPWVLIPIVGPAAIAQATFIMESWLVITLMAAIAYALTRTSGLRLKLALASLGAIGVVSRSDFIVFSFALAVGGILASRLTHTRVQRLFLVPFFGSILGFAFVMIHTLALSGSPFQTSARMKLHWTQVQGMDPIAALSLPVGLIVPPASSLLTVLVVALGVLGVSYVAIARRRTLTDSASLGLSGALGVSGYALFYTFDSAAIQPWYQGSFIVPIAMALGWVSTTLLHEYALTVGWTLLALFVGFYVVVGGYLRPVWIFQTGMLNGAQSTELSELPRNAIIGSWNAGVVAEMSGRHIVNLDGLVNDSAGRAALDGDLLNYITERGITHILDFDFALTDPVFAARGGYSTIELASCLTNPRVVDGGFSWVTGSRFTLYSVSEACRAELNFSSSPATR